MKPARIAVPEKYRSSTIYLRAFLNILLLLAVSMLSPDRVRADMAASIRVPQDYPTIQAAINAAQSGDVIIVSPGTYNEALTIAGKTITLASEFYLTNDPARIDQTIIDAGGFPNHAITVDAAAGPETQIIGLTIQNADDGIATSAKINILNNRIINTSDAIDSYGGGGLIKDNILENNKDDGVDLDRASSGTVQDNLIRNNGGDGIEIRLPNYTGPTLTVVIQGNVIEGNREDGIQFIDYAGLSNRVYIVDHNLIRRSKQVGIGLMDNGETKEDFRAASVPERIQVFNNTFSEQPYAITGGDNLIAVNNIFASSSTLALKNVDNQSIVAYNLFWNNAVDSQGSNIDGSTTLHADPLLDANGRLTSGSPAIDAGTASFVWNGETVLSYPPGSYNGAAPDLGWSESSDESPIPTPIPSPTRTPRPTRTPTPGPTPTLGATPTQGPQAVTLTVNPVGGGTVNVSRPGPYYSGDTVTLTAAADTHWTFSGWSGGAAGNENPKVITLAGDTAVTANFTPTEYPLTVNITGPGEVLVAPSKNGYTYGEQVTLTAIPAQGGQFVSWDGAASGAENSTTIAISGPTSVTGIFTSRVYTFIPLINNQMVE